MRTFMRLKSKNPSMSGTRNLPSASFLFACLAVFLFIGCASVETRTRPPQASGEPLTKPDQVLIYDFAFSPDQVAVDESIMGSAKSGEELEVGKKVANALSEKLVEELGKYGILANRVSGPLPTAGNVVYVKGRFLSIDEGNRTQRMVVGFGVGRSTVKAQGKVYQPTPQGPRLLGEFESEVKSGRKPGMGPMVGVGAAAGRAATAAAVSGGIGVVSEAADSIPFSASLEANVQKMAKDLAERAAKRWVKEGWLPKNVLK